ncbi:MAG: TRAP transporter small permease [Myxococcota bacterium]|nr:TRAP transporter small permease [Myxococcota bacterium]
MAGEVLLSRRAPSQRESGVTVRARRHLKWPVLDPLERWLMVLCALLLAGFTVCEMADVVFRNLGHPWLNANEVANGLFVWGVFLGMGVAVRRDQHFRLTAVGESLTGRKRWLVETVNRLVVLGVSACMIVFGYVNFLNGFGSFLMPSVTPIAILYAAIPMSGLLVALFTIEELVNGWRRGFQQPGAVERQSLRRRDGK